MSADLAALFAADGLLAELDKDYEQRPQQARMASAVREALSAEGRLVVEAGTGVGKSLGYLLPGALWAVEHGRRLLVSTHTRALQHQLVDRELPLVASVVERMGAPLRYGLLMGSENYLCLQRLDRLSQAPELFDEGEGAVVEALSSWAVTAASGLRSGFPGLVPQGTWAKVCRDPDLCPGLAGGFRAQGRCLYRRDLETAEAAHVLVVNHALLLSGAKLPAYDALVIDEAHNLEEAAVARFGLTVSERGVARLLAEVGAADGRRGLARLLARGAPDAVKPLLRQLKRSQQAARRFFTAVGKAHGLRPADNEAARLIRGSYGSWKAVEDLEGLLRELGERPLGGEELAEVKRLELRLQGLRSDVKAFLDGPAEGVAHWVEARAGSLELCTAPLDVGERLAASVFGRGIPAILTSATLSAGHGLSEFLSRVGCEGARSLVLDSPFDYETQAALLIVDGLPDPQEELSAAAVAAQCLDILRRVPGGVFILFSSWKALRRVHQILREQVTGRPLWAQGETGTDVLLEEFARAGNAVLLGVDTLWQGVDVPGAALSCVVLVKLPFPNFTSPIEEARREAFESRAKSYFGDFSLPRAVMKFRQGFGRLIRSNSDRGAFVVLDSRILHKGYGQAFLEALPRCRRLESVEELGAFFNEKSEAAGPAASQAPC